MFTALDIIREGKEPASKVKSNVKTKVVERSHELVAGSDGWRATAERQAQRLHFTLVVDSGHLGPSNLSVQFRGGRRLRDFLRLASCGVGEACLSAPHWGVSGSDAAQP